MFNILYSQNNMFVQIKKDGPAVNPLVVEAAKEKESMEAAKEKEKKDEEEKKENKPLVYVCTGKDCRDEGKPHKALLKALANKAQIRKVKCQKACNGQLAGFTIDSKLHWFEDIHSDKHRDALLHLIETGKIKKTLSKRINKGRQGKLR